MSIGRARRTVSGTWQGPSKLSLSLLLLVLLSAPGIGLHWCVCYFPDPGWVPPSAALPPPSNQRLSSGPSPGAPSSMQASTIPSFHARPGNRSQKHTSALDPRSLPPSGCQSGEEDGPPTDSHRVTCQRSQRTSQGRQNYSHSRETKVLRG